MTITLRLSKARIRSCMYSGTIRKTHSHSHKNTKGIRWHPLIIRWCLYLRHHSSKSYELLRDAGLCLPSQRTLREYTYSTTTGTGFSSSVDHQLLLASKVMTCKEWEKYVVVLIDEMYIRYDKYCMVDGGDVVWQHVHILCK